MKIAVLSGKGGTGKTFISTNLANIIKDSTYLDCDVEEPNGHIFFTNNEQKIIKEKVYRKIPSFNKEKCTGCKDCVSFCKFSALAFFADSPMLFSEVCHSCGGCKLVCKAGAIEEIDIEVGHIEKTQYKDTKVISGLLNIGEASAIPVINMVLEEQNGSTIIDCPPGSACSTMESIKAADFCLLVAEPTIFGLHNLKMIVELVTLFNIPFAFVINKIEDSNNHIIDDYVNSINKEILLKVPFKKDIANKVANGKLISEESKEYKNMFIELNNKIKERI